MYAQAFRDYGIDVEALSPEEVAQRMPDGAVRSELAAALDDWARLRRATFRRRTLRDWKRLVAAARATDPDPWRNRLREAWLKNDKKDGPRAAGVGSSRESTSVASDSPAVSARHDEYIALLATLSSGTRGIFGSTKILRLALIETESGDAREALRFYQAALALRPESPGVLLNLANALSKLDRHDEAIAVLERAIQIKPDYAAAYNNLGMRSSGRPEGAIAIKSDQCVIGQGRLCRSIRDPIVRHAHYNLGSTLSERRIGRSRDCIREAIRLNPRFTEAHCNLGAVLARKGDLDGAEEAHRRRSGSIRIMPKRTTGWAVSVRSSAGLRRSHCGVSSRY